MHIIIALTTLALGAMLIYVLRALAEQKFEGIAKNIWFWSCAAAFSACLTVASLAPNTQGLKPAVPEVANASQAVITEPEVESEPVPTPAVNDPWQALQNELGEKYSGHNYAILAIDLNRPERRLAVNADQEMPTASIYKLFMAYSILKAVDEGLSWDSALGGGTLSECFDKMVVASDNDCAHAWGDSHGWTTVMNESSAVGSRIELLKQDTSSTAGDIATLLTKLYNKELLSATSRDRLINTMKVQKYRQGIPTGAVDKVVANKVGFMNGTLADAGIVYGNTGAYVLVILTEGYSWNSIAETSALIDAGF
jgi:beta-lactamase class A